MKIGIGQINPIVGNFGYNSGKIIEMIKLAKKKGVDLVVFPELSLCGYFPFDLIYRPGFVEEEKEYLKKIVSASESIGVILGFIDSKERKGEAFNIRDPSSFAYGGKNIYFNASALIENKKIIGIQYKSKLPSFDVYNEERYFKPAEKINLFTFRNRKIGINICEDIWYDNGPYQKQAEMGADIIINISASPFYVNKPKIRFNMVSERAKKWGVFTVYANLSGGQDEIIFDGNSFAVNNKGKLIAMGKSFEEDFIIFTTEDKATPISPENKYESIFKALKLGIKDYFYKNGLKKAVVGLSGGIDSAVVYLLGTYALGNKYVTPIFMPSQFTSEDSKKDVENLLKKIGSRLIKIPIDGIFNSISKSLHTVFNDLPFDVAEENIQARIRGILLMAYANKFDGMVLATGNKTEIAVGYNTLYGDTVGGIAPIGDLYKDEVYGLSNYINENFNQPIPDNILKKAPSAELRENQRDEDDLPPYPILNKALKVLIEENLSINEIIKKGVDKKILGEILKRYYNSEYKRKQLPITLKVSPKAFGIGRKIPLTNGFKQ